MSEKGQIVVLGHSFVRNLEQDIDLKKGNFQANLGLHSDRAGVIFASVGGWKIPEVRQHVFRSGTSYLNSLYNLKTVILVIGGNDLAKPIDPDVIAMQIIELALKLSNRGTGGHVLVSQILHRGQNRAYNYLRTESKVVSYNKRVDSVNAQLKKHLVGPHVLFWAFRGNGSRVDTGARYLARDQIHLSYAGQKKFYAHIRGAATWSMLRWK